MQGFHPCTPLKPFLKEGFENPKNFHETCMPLCVGAGDTPRPLPYGQIEKLFEI